MPSNLTVMNGEIMLSGYVVSDTEAAWYGEDGGYFCPSMVRSALVGQNGALTVRINSDGGDPFAGEAIRSALAQYPGGVDMIVEGIAASAASLILMAGRKRSMSKGSLIMVHDPSTVCFGTEEELRRQADVTGILADTYASVYGAATGMSTEEARAIMRQEVWMGPDEAIRLGFATDVLAEGVGQETSMEAARSRFMKMQTGRAAMLAARKNSAQANPGAEMSAAAGGPPADTAKDEESEMSDKTPAANPAATPAPVAPVSMGVTAEQAIAAERARVSEIRMAAKPFMASGQLSEADVDAAVDAGTSADEARKQFLAKMAAAQPSISRATITRDEVDTRRAGMQAALTAQLTRNAPADDRASAFMSMSIAEMAAVSSGYKGPLRTAGDRQNALMAAAHSTSDFTGIFENALNKALLDRYQVMQPTYRKIARKKSFNDFRTHPMVRAGDFPNLLPVGENGEIKFGTFGEKRETAVLSAYAIGLSISRQMMINDELGAIADLVNDYGSRIAVFEEATFYSFMASATLASDGLAIWLAAATRGATAAGNLTSTGTAISVSALGIGKAVMRKQTGIDGAKLNLTPKILLVSPDKEIEALQFMTQVTPAQNSNVNPLAGTMEVVVSAELTGNAWYMFADPNMPGGQCFVYGYLNGAEAPRLRTEEPFGTQGWKMTLEHDFGLGAVDFRGTYKNNGA